MEPLEAVGATVPHRVRLALRSGDVVRVKIIRSLGGGRWMASIANSSMQIRSTVPLTPGTEFLSRVRWTGAKLLLSFNARSIGTGSPGAATSAGAILSSGLKRSGVSVDDGVGRRLRSVLHRSTNPDARNARLLGILYDKGLMPSSSVLDELRMIVDGSLRDGPKRGEEADTREPDNPDQGHDRGEASDEHRGSPDSSDNNRYRDQGNAPSEKQEEGEESLSSRIGRTLRLMGNCAGDGNALGAFNEIRGRRDDWVVVPFDVTIDGVRLRGSIRVRVGATNQRKSANITVKTDGGSWEAVLEGFRSGYRMSIECSERKLPEQKRSRTDDLREKLRSMGVDLDDTYSNGCPDGFVTSAENDSVAVDISV